MSQPRRPRPAGRPARRHRADDGRRPPGAGRRRRAGRRRPDRRRRPGPGRARRHASRSTRAGGIVMPGMIDTHRHMWQTAMRGYGADWTLTQYFVWYYLEYGKVFRPQDIHAGNLLGRARGARRRRHHHRRLVARAADDRARRRRRRRAAGGARPVRAGLRQHPGRARGSGPAAPEFRDFVSRRITGDDMLGFQIAFDVTGDPAFPEKPAFEVARDLGVPVTTHAGVWGATNDDGIRLMHEHGFMTPQTVYVHARHAVGRLLPPDRRDRRLGRRCRPRASRARARATRPPGRCARTASRSRCRWTPRVVERRPVLRDAHHAGRRPLPRAPGGARPGRDRHARRAAGRAGRGVGHPRRRAGAGPRGGSRQRRGRARRPTWC